MFNGLTRLALRWPKAVLLASVLLVGGALVYGLDVLDGLKTAGQVDPNSESTRAAAALESHFTSGRPNIVLLVRSDRSVDDPAVVAEGNQLATRLAHERDVVGVASYWQLKAPVLRSKDGHMAVIAARINGEETYTDHRFADIAPSYRGRHGPVDVELGGATAIRSGLTDTIRGDIAKAEAIGVPIVAVVLIIILRGFFAALLPLMVGAFSVIGTNAALKLISQFTDVSIFALNLATGLSLGLAADYGLFIVKRFREERRSGHSVEEALRITMNTAGRTVAFSSLTVAVSVSSMLVFPLYFLRSFAFAGVSVVLLAALCALVALPAALVVMGRLVDALDITVVFTWVARKFRGGRPANPNRVSGWRRWALLVMRRPVIFATSAIAIVVFLALPFLRLNIGLPDDRTLPAGSEPHQVQQALRDDFTSVATGELDVVVPNVQPAARTADISAYAARLSDLDGVVSVDTVNGRYAKGRQVSPPNPLSQRFAAPDSTYLAVSSDVEVVSSAGQDLVRRMRAVPAPFVTLVAGASSDLLDARAAIVHYLPIAMAIIAATTLILLFLLTGSVLIPFKAVMMNILSLSATFGVLVWIFQDYHLGGFFDFQQTGWVDVTLLVLLFCVAFGVSMDYEVFLLSRIKEEYARTPDNRTAVAYGIEKTGGIVTAAALITSIVFVAMGSGRVTNIKMFGVGLALAMIMDAALIRTLLVPALMRLAGRANWWAPAPLRKVYDKIGLKEGDVEPARPAAVPATPIDRRSSAA
jgi:putative drug exporter of the RND superfamily